ncbi:DivIVA domain-containing protein [Jiulongibacter sediminis]|mgnify:CR=1 FL=1|uniref:DivIVA domain-containing protein n=1 Tax=Jiulongibacter sediminis TaxID=1605367 RepID=UPI0026EFC176|nr:DivIVA domain-containing protein [Jiulongibacter sediminis]
MKITALEIKQHEFEKSFRGYNIEEVDIFLNNIANEWERTSNEAKMLRMQLEIAEKEAAKLREVEMSLIKTLQTAENTSSKITEQAKNEAESKIESAQLEAQRILEKAKKEAESIVAGAHEEVTESQKKLQANEEKLQTEIATLKERKSSIISQLKALSAATLEDLKAFGDEPSVDLEINKIVEPAKEAVAEIEEEEVKGFASSANTMVLEEETEEVEETKAVDLTVIEGIGPKIAELLNQHGIVTYRDLATQPAYKIREILENAGPVYAIHDPKTWSEQAMLADSGKWEELETLKEHLIGGKDPNEVKDAVEMEVEEEATPVVEATADTTEIETEASPENTTEEMLDRVNKVKAALKKAMMEKEQAAPKVKTINDAAAEAKENGGSFFDNI